MRDRFGNIYFHDKDHRYVDLQDVDARFKSVTGLIGEFTPEFRKEYWLVYKTLEAQGHHVESDNRQGVDPDHIRVDGKHKHYKDFGVDTRKLAREWETKSREGKERGSYLHKYLEHLAHRKFIQRIPEYSWQIEQANDYWFSNECNPIATELVIGTKDLGIAGQVDRVDRGGKLVDYKTDKEIKFENPWQSFVGPLASLDACNYNKYCLQLNLYAWIIERETDIKIREMEIVHFPPTRTELFRYRIYKVPDMRKLITEWMDYLQNKPSDNGHHSRSVGYAAI